MRWAKLLLVGTVSLFVVSGPMGRGTGAAQAAEVKWKRVVGILQTEDLVGVGPVQPNSGPGAAFGAAPWVTTDGDARVKLEAGKVKFDVKGLVLAVGSSGTFSGLPIGTAGPVTAVKGTLVCDLDGSAGGGTSTLVDTPAVELSAQGDAQFNGNVDPLPAACLSEPDMAFLIRVVEPAAFLGRWIAFGAVRTP